MTERPEQEGTLPPVPLEPEVREVPETHCAECIKVDPSDYFSINIGHESNNIMRRNKSDLTVTAIFGCANGHPLHEWPLLVRHNRITSTDQSLDPIGTDGLSPKIAPGLAQDLKEAAKCYHYGLNKGAVVIARRAIQLMFEDKIPGLDKTKRWTLGLLIGEARKTTPTILSSSGFSHAEIVLQFGNDGAHAAQIIDPRDARTVVWAAVRVLTELA